jgi:hypothetical protein
VHTSRVAIISFLLLSAFDSLNCLAQVSVAAASAPQRCSISGKVIGMQGGVDIKRARVWLSPLSADGDTIAAVQMSALGHGSSESQAQYAVMSQGNGSFCFENVKSGLYTLSGSRQGFLDTGYGAKSPTESGKTIIVGSEPLTGLTLELVPQSVVSGKVTDEDDEPVSGVSVALLMRMSVGGQVRNVPVRGVQSNDLGDFRLANVAPGAYYVVAEPRSGALRSDTGARRSLRTLYPGVSAFAQATPVLVGPGEERSGTNIRLVSGETHHIRGVLVGLTTADHGSVTIHPAEEEQVFIALGGANYKADGSFDFADLGPGSYALTYVQVAGDTAKGARRIVSVGERDVNDVVLSITNSATITGHIKIEGGSAENLKSIDFQKLGLSLSAADALVGPNARASIQSDGQFVIKNIVPGRYVVRASPPAGTYVKSIRFGQSEVRTQELDLNEGGSGEMDVIYRYGLASVSGSISGDGGAPVSGRIVLIPSLLDPLGHGLILGASDASNAFVVKNIPPGTYRAYAFESIDFAAMQDPAVLKALQSGGAELDIAESESKSVVLHLTSAEDQQRLIGIARGQQ